MIWYDMIWYDMIWYDMIWYMIWYDMIWYMIWYDMIWYDMDIWYDMIWYDCVNITWHFSSLPCINNFSSSGVIAKDPITVKPSKRSSFSNRGLSQVSWVIFLWEKVSFNRMTHMFMISPCIGRTLTFLPCSWVTVTFYTLSFDSRISTLSRASISHSFFHILMFIRTLKGPLQSLAGAMPGIFRRGPTLPIRELKYGYKGSKDSKNIWKKYSFSPSDWRGEHLLEGRAPVLATSLQEEEWPKEDCWSSIPYRLLIVFPLFVSLLVFSEISLVVNKYQWRQDCAIVRWCP